MSPEEAARANFYSLLARLFYAPPDAALLQAIARAEQIDAQEGGIAPAWRDLARAAAGADPHAVREEYETAFVGVGKAPITLYACAYSIRYTNEAPLAELRADLAALGLARRSGAAEPEDHIAALCETMRHLIAEERTELADQQRFFSRWIRPAMGPLCNAIVDSEITSFYESVARFAKSFFELELAAFEML